MTPFDPRLPIIACAAGVKTCHVFHCWQAMKAMGKQFHREAFAQFAGLNAGHVDAIIAALDANDAMPEGRAKPERRASRLPEDFTAPDDWIEWATSERQWMPADAREESEIFTNYWQAKGGKDAAKLNWKKTWQNWVRSSRRENGRYQPSVPMSSSREHMEATAALYEKMGRTNEAKDIRDQLAGNVLPFPDKVAR